MCDVIYWSGEIIETAEQLKAKVGCDLVPAGGYGDIKPDCCLCQVDIEATLENARVEYKEHFGHYFVDQDL